MKTFHYRLFFLFSASLLAAAVLLLGLGRDPVTRPDRFNGLGSKQIENDDFIIYLPSGLKGKGPRPLVVLLSPTADPDTLIRAWQGVAEEHRWLLLASKRFRNGIAWDEESSIYSGINNFINRRKLPWPVDRQRVIASGISGGGWGSHKLAYYYPALIAGVVINTGMMDAEFFRSRRDRCPKGKFAVFLASLTDFRYQEMTDDREFLKGLGWRTKWIEFSGGHVFAPREAYYQAAAWVEQEWEERP